MQRIYRSNDCEGQNHGFNCEVALSNFCELKLVTGSVCDGKGKGKVHPATVHEGPEVE